MWGAETINKIAGLPLQQAYKVVEKYLGLVQEFDSNDDKGDACLALWLADVAAFPW
jgi:hypothetical protein